MTIVNPWKESINGRDFEIKTKPIFKYKDCAIYKINGDYLYAKGNIAFNQLAGLNKNHLIAFADQNKSKTINFLYDRACESYDKGVVYYKGY